MDDFEAVLSEHRMCTVTYGVIKEIQGQCRQHGGTSDTCKENERPDKPPDKVHSIAVVPMHVFCCVLQVVQETRLYWCKLKGRKAIIFEDTPFSVADTKVLDCQYGGKYFKQQPVKGKHPSLQGTKKVGCRAHVEVKAFTLYPDFTLTYTYNTLSHCSFCV